MQHDVPCLVVAFPGAPTSQQAFDCTWNQWKTEVQGKDTRYFVHDYARNDPEWW
jgi:hypothetical protein